LIRTNAEELIALMLVAEGLYKSFGTFPAVRGIDLELERGDVLGFLGPNGAGKSTTMRMLTGYLTPDAGTVCVDGHSLSEDPIHAKSALGYLPEGAPAYPAMPVRDYLDFIGRVRGLEGSALKAARERVCEEVRITHVLHRTFEDLSKGYRRRVGLAAALIHRPAVLILDEPTDGLDPNQKDVVRRLIVDYAREAAVLISTHILEEVPAVCTRAVIVARGMIVAEGSPSEIASRSSPASLEASFRLLTSGAEDSVTQAEP
jgi:ABC-2 type transport system ATP-binding protein